MVDAFHHNRDDKGFPIMTDYLPTTDDGDVSFEIEE